MKRLTLYLLSTFLLFNSCQKQTSSFESFFQCTDDYDILEFTLFDLERGTSTDIELGENGLLYFEDLSEGEYELKVRGWNEGYEKPTLNYLIDFELPAAAGAFWELPGRPVRSETSVRTNGTVELRFDQLGGGCAWARGIRLYSSTSLPVEIEESNRIEPIESFGGISIVVNQPDERTYYIAETFEFHGINWVARGDTFSLGPTTISSNSKKLPLDEELQDELIEGIDTIRFEAQLDPSKHYRLDLYDSDNSSNTAFHTLAFSNSWLGEYRCQKPYGAPMVFQPPGDGRFIMTVRIAGEGEFGTFSVRLSELNLEETVPFDTALVTNNGEVFIMATTLEPTYYELHSYVEKGTWEGGMPVHLEMRKKLSGEVLWGPWPITSNSHLNSRLFGYDILIATEIEFLCRTSYYGGENTLYIWLEQ